MTKQFDFYKISQLFWRAFVRLEPKLQLFEVWEIMVRQIIIASIAMVINFKQLANRRLYIDLENCQKSPIEGKNGENCFIKKVG